MNDMARRPQCHCREPLRVIGYRLDFLNFWPIWQTQHIFSFGGEGGWLFYCTHGLPRTTFNKAAWLGDRTNWVFNEWYGPQASISLPRTMYFYRWKILFLRFLNNFIQIQHNYSFGGDGGRHSCVHMYLFGQHLIRLLDLVIERTGCSMNDMARRPQYHCREPWTFIGERLYFLDFWTILNKPNIIRASAGTEVDILVYTWTSSDNIWKGCLTWWSNEPGV